MNAIEALRPVTRVLQLFGLSMVTPCKQIKNIPFERITKCYSVFLIVLRTIAFLSMTVKQDFRVYTDVHKMSTAVEFIQFYSDFALEIAILVEALVKAHKEKQFMRNIQEIDYILIHEFDIDLKINELKRSAVKRLVVWICFIGLIFVRFSKFHFTKMKYFYCLTDLISLFATSLTYYQIILWTTLVRYRLHILNRLISSVNSDQLQQSQSCTVNSTSFESTQSNFDTAYDAHVLNRLGTICDLYNRLWVQTNLINVRFKYSMILHIGIDFVFLATNAYFTFLCLIKYTSCDSFSLNVTGIIVSMFYVSSLCIAGQIMADEASQVAYEIHRNPHDRRNIRLSSFVRVTKIHASNFQLEFFYVLDSTIFISNNSPKSAT